MSWLEEFKAFIKRGNVMDLAVAVIIGAAFGKIVNSLVSDLLMPLIGIATRSVNIADLQYEMRNPVDDTVLATLKHGAFLQACIDFILIAFCVFWLVKGINMLYKSPPKPVELSTQEKLLTEIRDLLKGKETSPEIKNLT